jgi:hypothetical protein
VALDLFQQSHPPQRVDLGTAEVHRLATFSQFGGPLDDGRGESVVVQPERRRRPRDTRAGNENVLGPHRRLPDLVSVSPSLGQGAAHPLTAG